MKLNTEVAATEPTAGTTAKRFVIVVEQGKTAEHHFCNHEELKVLQDDALKQDRFVSTIEITQGPCASAVYNFQVAFRDHVHDMKEKVKYLGRCRDALNKQDFPKDAQLRGMVYRAMQEMTFGQQPEGMKRLS